MRFDDRLQTLLDAPVADLRDRAVRWRQLVDLLSRIEGGTASPAVQRALDLVRDDAFMLDEQVRAAAVRAIAGRRVPSDLLRILAVQPVQVAAPLFAGLSMRHDEAAVILADADADVRALVAVAQPATIALPTPDVPPVEIASETEAPAPKVIPRPQPEPVVLSEVAEEAAGATPPSISEMVTRIERLKLHRVHSAPPASPPQQRPAPPSPSRGEARLFQWESDASGLIAWVEGAPRGALVGRSLGGDGVGLLERPAANRIVHRHPFIDVPVALAYALDGQWTATGVPAFDPGSGRFLGYRGLARRIDESPAAGGSRRAAEPDLHSLRELIHEIKTPLNAIIGFAEIIDGQYLGPAHRKYRDRAADIVAQARQLLSATEDLDFAAKLRSTSAGPGRGTDFKEIFPRLAEEMKKYAMARGAGIIFSLEGSFQRCALEPELSERLVTRFVTGVIDAAAPAETLSLAIAPYERMCAITLSRPEAIRHIAEETLLDPAYASDYDDKLGIGFALRLVRGLARMAGGDLRIEVDELILLIPAQH